MQEFFAGPGARHFGMLVMVVGFFLFGIVAVVMVQWRKHRQCEIEAVLKQQMIERGMSADDIVRILQAGMGQSANRISSSEAVLQQKLGQGNGVAGRPVRHEIG